VAALLRGVVGAAIMLGVCVVPQAAHAEIPDTRTGVTHTSSIDTNIYGRIGSATDKDWFRFRMTSSGRARITLTYQPANYRLDLYGSGGRLLASSARRYRQFEEIYRHFDAGTYYVRVASQDGTHSADRTYQLRFSRLAPGLRVLSASHWKRGLELVVACDILNNTAHWQIVVSVEIELVDRSGIVYAQGDGGPTPDVVGPHKHTTCEGSFDAGLLRRLDHVRVLVGRYERTQYRGWPISVLPGSAAEDPAYGTVFRGLLRNDGTTNIHYPSVRLVFYGSGGRITDMQSDWLSKRWLAPGATTEYFVVSRRVSPYAFYRPFVSAAGTRPQA
jgi:hypothetical protein